MSEELSYVLITPYTIRKSRTGGVMARLLSRTDLDLVGTQILAPTKEFAEQYAALVKKTVSERDPRIAKLFSDYIKANFVPHSNGRRERIMFLLFRGEDACRKLFHMVGFFLLAAKSEEVTGETIRDTYGDLVTRRDGAVSYFEPAVMTPPSPAHALEKLSLFAEFAKGQPNIVDNIVGQEDHGEKTLVMIKPDNWRHPSTKPGNIIDILSRTGLRIVGCKIYQMSVAEALEFYGPVKHILYKKYAPLIGERARTVLEREFQIQLHKGIEAELSNVVGIDYANEQFAQIIEFMSGKNPENILPEELNAPGQMKCMVLIYEGKNAIRKIRHVLGPTDPTKAPAGTVRRDFGHNVMVNTAHASDSLESVQREMNIVKININPVSDIINGYLKAQRAELIALNKG
ncbi:MAG: nucleoside-diphosphate kinase [bacterium]